MTRPVIFAVDDDPAVLAAVSRDLRREYADDYRVLRAESGAEALEALRELRRKGEPVALLVVDQRMPGMTGVELLREAMDLYPEAKRVLLTAYADTEVAIRAINEIRLDQYLLKPWDPPEERLYPVLTDLLEAWRADFRPPFEGVRVIGHRWSAEGHRLRDFLSRNLIPYRWLDVEEDEEALELLTLTGAGVADLPVVVLPDGTSLTRPEPTDLAERIGLRTRAQSEFYDLVIVGAGPAGLAAAVYGASEGLRTVLIECEAPGGQAGMSSSIENYLGFPVGLSGGDLARRAVAQARRFGAEILTPLAATGVRLRDEYRIVKLSNGVEIATKALLVATGVSYRMLDVPGARRFAGAGLYYGAAITEGMASRGGDVFVVGGGNSAGQAAMYLARFARTVTILVRGRSLESTMSRYLIDQLERTANVRIRFGAEIAAVEGDESLASVSLLDRGTGERSSHPARAVFVFIGAAPRTEWVSGIVERDALGYILSGPDLLRSGERPAGWDLDRAPFWLETSTPGILVAGDVRHRSIKRIASAVGEGAMAVQFVHQHLAAPVLGPRAPSDRAGEGAPASPLLSGR